MARRKKKTIRSDSPLFGINYQDFGPKHAGEVLHTKVSESIKSADDDICISVEQPPSKTHSKNQAIMFLSITANVLKVMLNKKTQAIEFAAIFSTLATKKKNFVDPPLTKKMVKRLFTPFVHQSYKPEEAWFNTKMIEAFFERLPKNFPDKGIECISPFIFQIHESFLHKFSQGKQKKLRNKLRKAELIFWPIFESDHWYLLVFEKQNGIITISCFDGLNRAEDHPKFLNVGISLLKRVCQDQYSEIQANSIKIPRQHNSEDCGAVICFFATRYCQGVSAPSLMEKLQEVITKFEKAKTGEFCDCDYSETRIDIYRFIFDQTKALSFKPIHPKPIKTTSTPLSVKEAHQLEKDPPRLREISPAVRKNLFL